MDRYNIGDIWITWDNDKLKLKKNRHIEGFLALDEKNGSENLNFEIVFDDLKKHCNGILLKKNGLIELYQTEKGKFLMHHWMTSRFTFGVYAGDLEKGNSVTCYVNPEAQEISTMSVTRFLTSAGLHSKLLQKDAIVFHSAYIDWKGKAVLFAGDSGVGKSTQAKLWKKYADSETINGDRTLIRRKNGIWHAYGYPSCGSSDICINRTLPLSTIVLLEQGEENRIETLSVGQKFRALLTGSAMYLWNEKEMERVIAIAEELVREIKIIKLICRPDSNAVEVLKAELEGTIHE